jgi:hypothetical protein
MMNVMRWLLAAVWLGSSLLACQASREPDRFAPREFAGRGFRMTIQADVLSNTIKPAPGVSLYDFHVGSTPILFAYAGDTPGWPHFAGAPEHADDSTLSTGLSARCHSIGNARECLIALGDKSPQKLHVWYEKLDGAMAKRADAIIDSVSTTQ